MLSTFQRVTTRELVGWVVASSQVPVHFLSSCERLRIGQQSTLAVFAREHRFAAERPIDAERGVVPPQRTLMFGRPVVGGLVQAFGALAGNHEAVRKARRYPQLAPVFRRQFNPHPAPEKGGGTAHIDHHIVNRPLSHPHQLSLRLTDLVVQAAQDIPGGLGMIILNKIARQACQFFEPACIETLEKKTRGRRRIPAVRGSAPQEWR